MRLLTTQEAADYLHVPAGTLRYWRHLGNFGPPSARIGARVFYREEDCEAFVNEQFAEQNEGAA